MATKKVNPKRQELIQLSQQAKALRELGDPSLEALEGELTINNIIMNIFYPEGEYNTFKGWLAAGSVVKKGSKSFPIWGKKRKMKRTNNEGEESEFDAFPVANLFHESQVEPKQKDIA